MECCTLGLLGLGRTGCIDRLAQDKFLSVCPSGRLPHSLVYMQIAGVRVQESFSRKARFLHMLNPWHLKHPKLGSLPARITSLSIYYKCSWQPEPHTRSRMMTDSNYLYWPSWTGYIKIWFTSVFRLLSLFPVRQLKRNRARERVCCRLAAWKANSF